MRGNGTAIIAQLRTQPGIVVTDSGRRDGKYQLAGLRDPLAANPDFMHERSRD